MSQINHFLSGLLYIETFIIIALAVIIWRRRKVAGVLTLFLTCLCAITYTLGYSMEIVSTTLEEVDFWGKLQYLGLSFIPYFWFLQASLITGQRKKVVKILSAVFVLISILTIIVRITNPYYHLMYKNMRLINNGYFLVLKFDQGLWYRVFCAYFFLCVVLSMIFYSYSLHKSTGYRYWQIKILLFSSSIPIVGLILNFFNLVPLNLDSGPLITFLLLLLYIYSIFRYDLMHIIPLSRQKIFEWIYDGVIVVDLNFLLKDFNQAAKAIFKSLDKSCIGTKADLCVPEYPDFFPMISSWYEENKLTLKPSEEDSSEKFLEFSLSDEEGNSRYYRIRPRALYDKEHLIGITILILDITKEKSLVTELIKAAQIDAVTEIFNRRYCIELIHKELVQLQQNSGNGVLFMFDLDDFKVINDAYGHQAGDYILKEISSITKGLLRENDIFGRYGGEEFIVFLPSLSLNQATDLVEKIRLSFQDARFLFGEHIIQVTASFGIAEYYHSEAGTYDSFDELVSIADTALYKAKDNGRNQYAV